MKVGEKIHYINGKNSYPTIAEHINGGVKKRVNYSAIPSFLMYQYGIGGETLFKGIRYTVWDTIEPFPNKKWDPVVGLMWLIDKSIESKVSGKCGMLLSGGIDSSVICALGRSHIKRSYSATFDTHSEYEKAKLVADSLKLDLYELKITEKMVAYRIEEITKLYEEPLADAGLINSYFLCQAAADCDTVMSGDGGDEIFGGYPWHHYAKYIPLMDSTPAWLRGMMQHTVSGNPVSSMNRMERILLFPMQEDLDRMILYPTTAMSYQNVRWLLDRDFTYQYVPYDGNIYKKALGTDVLNMLPGKFGIKTNKYLPKMVSPYIDADVASFAFSLDDLYRKDKLILRLVAEGLVPGETVWRKKAGFGTPIRDWLEGEKLKPMVLDRMENGKLLKEICEKKSLKKVVEKYRSGLPRSKALATSLPNVIWGLFTLQVWHDVWFGR